MASKRDLELIAKGKETLMNFELPIRKYDLGLV